MKDRVWKPTDAEKLAWLSRCSKVDNSGQDGAWAFELLHYNHDSATPLDVRIALRVLCSLSESVEYAMRFEKEIGK